MVAQLKGIIYPDKSFSIGRIPSPKKRAEDRRYDRESEQQFDSYLSKENKYGRISLESVEFSRITTGDNRFIKSPKSSPRIEGGYGKHGITRFGKKVVKNGTLLLQQRFGKKRLGFVTCTLPDLGAEQLAYISAQWGEVSRRFYQKLKRKLKKQGKPFHYVGCTEIQEKRFRNTGLAIPHLHFVYLCRDRNRGGFNISAARIRINWRESICEVLRRGGYEPVLTEKEYFASVDCQVVKKNAASYLGKYMSKGVGMVQKMLEKGIVYFPKQWWTASQTCKKMFKESLIRMDAKTCESFFYQLEHYLHEGIIVWASFIDIIHDGKYLTVGLVGTLSLESYRLMKEK